MKEVSCGSTVGTSKVDDGASGCLEREDQTDAIIEVVSVAFLGGIALVEGKSLSVFSHVTGS